MSRRTKQDYHDLRSCWNKPYLPRNSLQSEYYFCYDPDFVYYEDASAKYENTPNEQIERRSYHANTIPYIEKKTLENSNRPLTTNVNDKSNVAWLRERSSSFHLPIRRSRSRHRAESPSLPVNFSSAAAFVLDTKGIDSLAVEEEANKNKNSIASLLNSREILDWATLDVNLNSLGDDPARETIFACSKLVRVLFQCNHLFSSERKKECVLPEIPEKNNVYSCASQEIIPLESNALKFECLQSQLALQASEKATWCPTFKRVSGSLETKLGTKRSTKFEQENTISCHRYFSHEKISANPVVCPGVNCDASTEVEYSLIKHLEFVMECWKRKRRLCFLCGMIDCRRSEGCGYACYWIRCDYCGGRIHGDHCRQMRCKKRIERAFFPDVCLLHKEARYDVRRLISFSLGRRSLFHCYICSGKDHLICGDVPEEFG